jgi:hypothetical protein
LPLADRPWSAARMPSRPYTTTPMRLHAALPRSLHPWTNAHECTLPWCGVATATPGLAMVLSIKEAAATLVPTVDPGPHRSPHRRRHRSQQRSTTKRSPAYPRRSAPPPPSPAPTPRRPRQTGAHADPAAHGRHGAPMQARSACPRPRTHTYMSTPTPQRLPACVQVPAPAHPPGGESCA